MRLITRVIVVEDESVFRAAMCASLATLPNLVVTAQTHSGKDAISLCRELKPDLVLLKLNLKDMSGLEVAATLLEKKSELNIIIITDSLDSSSFPLLFSYGVRGFFNKTEDFKELTSAIQYVSSGRTYISIGFKKIQFEKKKVALNPLDLLSERELQVALLVYNGFNNSEISKRLNINISTLKTYRSRLCEKLGIQNEIEITVLIDRFKFLQNHY